MMVQFLNKIISPSVSGCQPFFSIISRKRTKCEYLILKSLHIFLHKIQFSLISGELPNSIHSTTTLKKDMGCQKMELMTMSNREQVYLPNNIILIPFFILLSR